MVSVPSGVFEPYAGVSTAILFLTRGGRTERIWFYDMAHDGFSLDDKRTPIAENDIPDVVDCWKKRNDREFSESREKRIVELRKQLTPLKAERLKLHADINRLTFEQAIASIDPLPASPSQHPAGKSDIKRSDADQTSAVGFGGGGRRPEGVALSACQQLLSTLDSQISAPQSALDRLTRQFWVDVAQVRANKYDLSASRYRQADNDETYHEAPQGTLERLSRLEQVMAKEIEDLKGLLE